MTTSRYYCDEFVQSMYCYPNTNTLINKLDILDDSLLKQAETELTQLRLYRLYRDPIKGKFSVTHLKSIHKYIFQDVYYFAGKFREETIIKDNTKFCESKFIEKNLKKCIDKLRKEKFLVGLNQKKLSERLAYYMSELNIIHPFREGNGRAIREFIRCLALKRGYTLNWDAVDKDVLLNTSIESVIDHSNLSLCIESCLEHKK